MLSDAYIAGFFDGEGHIGVYTRSDAGRTCSLRTQLTQNEASWSWQILTELRDRFGGNVSIQPTLSGGTKLNWQLNSDKAANFLATILPHLVIKREQAEVACAWQRSRPPMTRDARGRIVHANPRDVARDVAVSQLVKLLKTDPLETIINRQADLIEIVHTLKPIMTVKGDSRARDDWMLAPSAG